MIEVFHELPSPTQNVGTGNRVQRLENNADRIIAMPLKEK